MSKKYYKQWHVPYEDHQIKVTNWWNFDFDTEARLYLDDQLIAVNKETDMSPFEPMFHLKNVSEEIKEIKVFLYGALIGKLLIEINNQNIYKDKLSFLDRYLLKRWDGFVNFLDNLEERFTDFTIWRLTKKKRKLLFINRKKIDEMEKTFDEMDAIDLHLDDLKKFKQNKDL